MPEPHSIVAAIKSFVRISQIDPAIAPYERIAYKAALVRQGASIEHLAHAADEDARIMRRAVAATK